MSGKESDGFPNGLEAFFLVVALLGATWLAYGLLSALAPLTGLEPREFPGVAMVLGNGIVFSALLAYKKMGYASLFHSSDRSVRSTMGMLTVPVLLLVPGMVLAS
jgi:hypothetical protein